MDRDPAADEYDMLSSLLQAARATLQAEEDSEAPSRAVGAFRVTAGGGQSPEFADHHQYGDEDGTRTPPAATRGTPRTASGAGAFGGRSGLNATATPFLTRQQTPPHAAPQVMFSPFGDSSNYSSQLATWPPPHSGGNSSHQHLSHGSSSPAAHGSGPRPNFGSHAYQPSLPPFHQQQQHQTPVGVAAPQNFSGGGNAAQHDAVSLDWIQQFAQQNPHLIAVLNLEPRTTKKQLWDIFYPMGAVDTAVMGGSANSNSVPGGGGKRGVGVVMFSSADMAKIAAEKMNDFVPHGQSFPLVVSYVSPRSIGSNAGPQQPPTQPPARDRFGRTIGGGISSQPSSVPSSVNTSSITADSNASSHGGGGGQAASSSSSSAASAPVAIHDGIPEITPEMSNASLLNVFVSVISRRGLGADDIATILLRILCRPQSTKTLIEDTVRAIRDHIDNMGPHSTVFTAPLARALQYVTIIMEPEQFPVTHSVATLPPPAASLLIASANRLSPSSQQMFASFKVFFSQVMLQLLFNASAEATCRSVAGVMIGYLFELEFLGGAPFEMAAKLLATNRASFVAAQEYANAGSDPEDPKAQQHVSASHLVEALSAMTSSWASRHPSRTPDSSEEIFQAFLRGFTFAKDHDATGSTDVSRSSLPPSRMTPRGGHEGHQQRRTPPPTPSSHSAAAVGYSPAKVHPGPQRPGSTSPSSEVAPGDLSTDSVGSAVGGYSVNAPGIWQAPQRLVPPAQPQLQTTSGSFTFETTLQKDLLACTVYLTKLPGGLTDAKIRRLITYFGEFNKVRMYKEKTPPALRGGGGAGSASSQQNRGCFGFVEYAQPSSAKAVIDYFRNASMTSNNAFHFLIGGDLSTAFTIDEIGPLSLTRASYAKSAIHDQHPKDAIFEPIVGGGEPTTTINGQPNVKVQGCMFGLVGDGAGGAHHAAMLQQHHLQQHPAPSAPFGQQNFPLRPQSSGSLLLTPQRAFRPLDAHVDPAAPQSHNPHNSSLNTTASSTNSNDQLGAFKLGLFDTDTTW
jgi:RNA recognition motif-containing protein